MPTYNIKNKKTGKITTETMTISEMEAFEKANPDKEVMCGAPILGYNYSRMKPSDDFRDRLREMKKKHPGNNINIM